MARPGALPVVFACLVLAGCVGLAPDEVDPAGSQSVETTTSAELAAPTDCGDVTVSFYAAAGDRRERLWAPDVVRVGYTLPAGASVLLVAYEGDYENGTVLGVERARNGGEHPVAADGASVDLDAPLAGEHTVSVVPHADADGDGEFDRRTDPACRNGGRLVAAGPATFDFDAFAGTTDDRADTRTSLRAPAEHRV